MKQSYFLRAMMVALLLAAVLLLVIVVGVGAADYSSYVQEDDSASAETGAVLSTATNWLVSSHQNDDGGFASFSMGANSAPSDIGGTVDALLALAPSGADFEQPLNYLRENIEQTNQFAAIDGSTAGKLILSLVAAGEDPGDFMGYDFAVALTDHLSPTGEYGVTTAFNQSLAILALTASGESVPDIALDWLLDLQERAGDLEGSWSDGFGTDGNADSTAMAVMALTNSDNPAVADAVTRAKGFLGRTQLQSGGWEYGLGFGENANSTALVLQALGAAGEDVSSPESQWIKGGITPVAALLSWQGESGAFQADFGEGRFDDFFSTVQSIPAIAAVQDQGEQIIAPARATDVSSEPDTPAETESPMEVDEESGEQSDDTATETQNEDLEESEDSGGGFSLCPSAFALTFIAGLVLFVPKRRRR